MSSRPAGEQRERRLVTVLFADLAGYTAAADTMDPEDVHAFLEPLMDRLAEIVEAFGGTVVKTMGDGLMAVFGAPVTHLEDAERAVRAAIAMRTAVATAALNPGARVRDVHAGVQTGPVFVVPGRGGIDVIGDTVNTAARLLGLAPGGSIFVGEPTMRRTEDVIRYDERGPLAVKGKSKPVSVYEVVEERPAVSLKPPHAYATPFVGRLAELGRLRDAFDVAVQTRRSKVLFIVGPPGIGKSRLTHEFISTAGSTTVLVGRAVPYGEHVPWFPLAQAFRAHCGIEETDVPGVVQDKLAAAARAAVGYDERDLTGIVRGLDQMLGLEPVAAGRQADTRALNSEIASGVRRFLAGIATERPVVLVLEDVQWADPQLGGFLEWMCREPWDAPVLVIGLGRSETNLPGVEDQFALDNLEDADSHEIIGALLAGGEPTDPAARELATRAGGNPLFLEEIVRLFRERGILRLESGRWSVSGSVRAHVPESVQLVVAARIDDLDENERRLLRDAAICGESFTAEALSALSPGASLETLLGSLETKGFVTEGAGGYAFKHAVIRDVAYETLPRSERAEKHIALAEWLRARAAGREEPVEMLAYHYSQAAVSAARPGDGVKDLALEYLVRAGDRAFALRAYREAEAWYAQALEIEDPSVAVPAGLPAIRALLRHAAALLELHRFDGTKAETTRALELARDAGETEWETECLLQMGRLESEEGNVERARELLAVAQDRFAAAGDDAGRAHVLWATGRTLRLTDVDRMLELFEQAARLFAAAGDEVNEHVLYEQLAYGATPRGGDEYERWYSRSQALAARAGDLRSRAALLRTAGFNAFYRGDVASSVAPLEEARSLARETADFFVECDATYVLGRIRVAEGALDDAERLGDALVRAGRAPGGHRIEEQGHVLLARVTSRRGEDASEHLRIAEELLTGAGNEREIQEVVLARAQIALDRGQWAAAESAARDYGERANRFGDRLERPVAALVLARSMLGAGRLEEAAAALADAGALARDAGQEHVAFVSACLSSEVAALLGRDALVPSQQAVTPEQAAVRAEAAGAIAWAAGDEQAAVAAFEEAERSWERLGVTVWLDRVRAMRLERSQRSG